ncbi:Uroporphyrinogen decarboxylase [Zancudomyces culisetae]|uniref:Uroporphyrinogen decarboxylase n=1 Tax=Zancudomyces culisetae TaxID=1213189 RepID=A0A1R1PPL2_ZANCU|nr:Uroporphyrinogen decarboxylase [Zancudomyces culisetae]|eukprot:OMH82904.1 Uroporphyrinogen decarboxylase [Zancudomyces culisetae]
MRTMNEFFKVCRTPELAAEVTLQPMRRYNGLLDASIIFSDILVVPQAMGLEVQMIKGKGPHFPEPLDTPKDMARLVDMESGYNVDDKLGYVYEAITLTRKLLDGQAPLFGFIGAPWTLMAYMVEGGGSKTFERSKKWLYLYPKESHELLDRITTVSIEFLKGQVRAGAQLVQVFDSWAGVLSPEDFMEFSFPYMKRIAKELKNAYPEIPTVAFPKGLHEPELEAMALDTEYTALSIDWTLDPEKVIDSLGEKMKATGRTLVLQGNLDPTVLFAEPEVIARRVEVMCKKFKKCQHIANLGHGMMPGHDPEHLRVFLEAVHKYSKV